MLFTVQEDMYGQFHFPKLVETLCRGDGRPGSISGFVTLTEEDCAKIYKLMI